MKNVKTAHFYFAGVFVLLAVIFLSLFVGRYSVSPIEVIQILLGKISGNADKSVEATVVWNIRLPRVLLSILVGAGLSGVGAAFQGIFHNPLVSPDILGVSNGAGFGAALGIFLTAGLTVWTTSLAFLFGIASVMITFMISKIIRNKSVLTLVLSGMVVASVFNALLSLIKLVADTEDTLPAITYWLMGSFSSATFFKVLISGIPIAAGLIVLFLMRWKINVLSMGEEEAYALGVNPRLGRLIIIIASTLVTAACVMVSGIIGWVGLILPNICREYFSADYKKLLPASCLFGAVFMVTVDFIARTVTQAEIPIGILTALVGGPVFIATFKRTGGDGA